MSQNQSIARVVVADDSDIAAAFIECLLEGDPHIRVIGRAINGSELLRLPQVGVAQTIIVDVLMPELGGLSVIRRLSARSSVIAVSSVPSDSLVASEALALGAVAFFNKRDLSTQSEAERLREIVRRKSAVATTPALDFIVLVVGSTGAIGPLELLVQDLPEKVPILILQHLPEGKEDSLARLLTSRGRAAHVARHGEPIGPQVVVACAGRHMELDAYEDRIRLFGGPAINGHCPSGDLLLRSAARLGPRAVAVILSGLGTDGAQGMAALAHQGATCVVQHPSDAQAASMPKAALTASWRVRPVRTVELGPTLRKLIGNARSQSR